jgi:hypothetical protein
MFCSITIFLHAHGRRQGGKPGSSPRPSDFWKKIQIEIDGLYQILNTKNWNYYKIFNSSILNTKRDP